LGGVVTEIEYEDGDFVPGCSEPVAEFTDLGSADAIAGLLAGQGIHTKVEPFRHMAGLPRAFRVLVDPRQLHRARWFLENNDISENELIYLATGKLPNESE
jgi:hypothetical protein